MLTVTKLARRCGVSRTALLYYESIGLMAPPERTGGNYRCYSEADAERVRAIRAYRNAGLKLEDIRAILSAILAAAATRQGSCNGAWWNWTPRSKRCAPISTRFCNCWGRRRYERQR